MDGDALFRLATTYSNDSWRFLLGFTKRPRRPIQKAVVYLKFANGFMYITQRVSTSLCEDVDCCTFIIVSKGQVTSHPGISGHKNITPFIRFTMDHNTIQRVSYKYFYRSHFHEPFIAWYKNTGMYSNKSLCIKEK